MCSFTKRSMHSIHSSKTNERYRDMKTYVCWRRVYAPVKVFHDIRVNRRWVLFEKRAVCWAFPRRIVLILLLILCYRCCCLSRWLWWNVLLKMLSECVNSIDFDYLRHTDRVDSFENECRLSGRIRTGREWQPRTLFMQILAHTSEPHWMVIPEDRWVQVNLIGSMWKRDECPLLFTFISMQLQNNATASAKHPTENRHNGTANYSFAIVHRRNWDRSTRRPSTFDV